jgi:hypothetical protein
VPCSWAARAASFTFALLCVASGGSTAFAQPPGGQIVDRVVAVVRLRSGVAGRPVSEPGATPLPADIITLSGLEFEARVALVQRGAIRAATEPLDDEALRGALEYAISERLLAGEADALDAWRVEAQDVENAVNAFRQRFAHPSDFSAFLARHEADDQALARVLERSLRASKVLDSKVRLRAQVPEAEVRRYYEAHRTELGKSYEELRTALREKLVRDRYQQLAEAELEQLRRTHDVRRIAPFARRTGRAG